MPALYILRKTSVHGKQRDHIVRRADGAFIPNDPGNRDYRDYQAWIDAGNEPDLEDQVEATGERKPGKKAK